MISLLLVLLSQNAFASDIKLGTFALATEAGWTASFELKADNEAFVSPAYDTEDFDPASRYAPKPTPQKGKWKSTKDGLDLTYGTITDHFKFEPRCKEWPSHPCFRFLNSASAKKEKSVLDYRQPYINWDWTIEPLKSAR